MTADWDLNPDHSRSERLGFDETVFCASKSPDQINRLLQGAQNAGDSLLLTRLAAEKFAALDAPLSAALDFDKVSQTAIFGPCAERTDAPRVAVVSAGTSDVPVAREATRTLPGVATRPTSLRARSTSMACSASSFSSESRSSSSAWRTVS